MRWYVPLFFPLESLITAQVHLQDSFSLPDWVGKFSSVNHLLKIERINVT